MAQDFAGPMQARGMGCPLGKFTEEVKTHLDEVTFKAWLQLCHARNVTSSELLRDLVFLIVHAKTPAELSADDRRELLRGEGLNGALERLGARP